MSDGLPAYIKPLKDQSIFTIEEALGAIFQVESFVDWEVAVGYAYDRKGEVSFDSMDAPRNKSYGSDYDDVVLSITVRLYRDQFLRHDDLLQKIQSSALQAKKEELVRLRKEIDTLIERFVNLEKSLEE